MQWGLKKFSKCQHGSAKPSVILPDSSKILDFLPKTLARNGGKLSCTTADVVVECPQCGTKEKFQWVRYTHGEETFK